MALFGTSRNNGSLDAGAMRGKGRLHLSSPHAVPRDVDDVIHAPRDGVHAVCVALAAVPCEVVSLCIARCLSVVPQKTS